jgi:hypothetical protein
VLTVDVIQGPVDTAPWHPVGDLNCETTRGIDNEINKNTLSNVEEKQAGRSVTE